MPLVLILYLLFEFFLSLELYSRLEFVGSLLWIVATGMVGLRVMRIAPVMMQAQIIAQLQGAQRGNSAAYPLISGIGLIIPGVLSDIIGIILLVPIVTGGLLEKKQPKEYNTRKTQGENDVIDVEVID